VNLIKFSLNNGVNIQIIIKFTFRFIIDAHSKMKKSTTTQKAYKNLTFLNSSDGRIIRILSEFLEPYSRFKKYSVLDTIVFFGSARLISRKDALKKLREAKKAPEKESRKILIEAAEKALRTSKYYEDAVELSRRLSDWSLRVKGNKKRFIVCSGGGPGIMEAANKGAKAAGAPSMGLNISIPFEQFINEYVDPELAFEFHYFFMRKFWFAYLAKALVVFPGGFGTMDELMEILTLLQTGKIKKIIKVVVYDRKYWEGIINFEAMISEGTISRSDMKLFEFCDSVDEAFRAVTRHLKKHYFTGQLLNFH